jgi:hypothetical protein
MPADFAAVPLLHFQPSARHDEINESLVFLDNHFMTKGVTYVLFWKEGNDKLPPALT